MIIAKDEQPLKGIDTKIKIYEIKYRRKWGLIFNEKKNRNQHLFDGIKNIQNKV